MAQNSDGAKGALVLLSKRMDEPNKITNLIIVIILMDRTFHASEHLLFVRDI